MYSMRKSHFMTEGRRPDALDLHAVEGFVRVCEAGSMTAAASLLGTTQSAVSRSVQRLERRLGTTLLDRETRPLRATPAGEVLLEHATRLLGNALAAALAVRAVGESAAPHLRLGLVDSFAGTLGADLITSLRREAGELRVWSGLSRQLADGLRDGELDILITADPLEEMVDLRVERVFREPFLLVLPRAMTTPDTDLTRLAASMALVRYSLRSVTGRQVERYLRSLRLEPPRRMEFDGSESVVAMVQEGLGWALTTPLCLIQGRADFARLSLHPLPPGAPHRGLFLVCRAGGADAAFERVAVIVRRLLRRLQRKTLRRLLAGSSFQVEVL